MDIHTLLEIDSDVQIVDVGASLGETPIYDEILKNGWGRVTGFEPNKEEVAKLNASKKPYENYLPYFIGSGDQETFYETSWNLTGSLYEPNTELLKKFNNLNELVTLKAMHPVETHRLDDIKELPQIDFLKMDIQGSELNALKNGVQKLRETLVIQVEVEFLSLYKKQPLFADVDIFLRQQGFQFHTFPGFGSRAFKPIVVQNDVNRGVRQYIWSDAIYVRDWMNLSPVSTEKLKKYALIMHCCYGSVDLVHLLLSHIDANEGSDYVRRYMDFIVKTR
jgi:FkbM family methyltransferase